MRNVLATFVFFAFAVGGAKGVTPGSPGVLQQYVDALTAVDGSVASAARIEDFALQIVKRSAETESAEFVHQLVRKAHQRFLKRYAEYATFTETLSSGKYNCLTGTALYALLLEQFQIPYRIVETNYHIFLLAETSEGLILIEATDGENGLVYGEENIAQRIAVYRQQVPANSSVAKQLYRYDHDVFNEVELQELAGLLHYNKAIVAFNERDLRKAVRSLSMAAERYESTRIAEFAHILQIAVATSQLPSGEKKQYARELEKVRAATLPLSARHQAF